MDSNTGAMSTRPWAITKAIGELRQAVKLDAELTSAVERQTEKQLSRVKRPLKKT